MTASAPQKILGVLGGMGPAASAEFLRLLALRAQAKLDQEHPRVIMFSDPGIPDRSAAIAGHGPDPEARIRSGLDKLAAWGADLLTCPCNTAHVFIDRFAADLPRPFVHIVRETVTAAHLTSPEGAWLLATTGTIASGLYGRYAHDMGYVFHMVSERTQEKTQRCVELVKAGAVKESGTLMRSIAEGLWKEKNLAVATACTELPLAYAASGLPAEKNVSSLTALADACLAVLYADIKKDR
ncbi:MAG: amino acid racemase [Desulfovibrio sp.]|jgi:aspartate racemase|nr:amino acid racemase [Desulfovibrio sp.]